MKNWAAVALLALAGCGGADFTSGAPMPTGCTPGEQLECSCPGGAKSVQTCNDQGTSFGACACGAAGDSGGDSGGMTCATANTIGECKGCSKVDGIPETDPGVCPDGFVYNCPRPLPVGCYNNPKIIGTVCCQ